MPERIVVAAAGAAVCIDLSALGPAEARAVRAAWRDAEITASVPGPAGADGPTVVAAASVPLPALLADLSQRVTLAAIEAARGTAWMLHAAGVATDDGRVVVFVGASGRGKTTAANALGQACGYVSDETVAIAADGAVHPYCKPLSIVDAGANVKAQRAGSDLGLRALPDAPLRLGAVVLLHRSDDAPAEPVVEAVDLGDALPELVAQSSYLADLRDPLQTIARHVAVTGGVRRVRYRDAAALAPLMPMLLDQGAPEPGEQPWREYDDLRGEPFDPSPSGLDERGGPVEAVEPGWSRVPAVDELPLRDPDRIALMHVDVDGRATVRVLAGIAPALWKAATDASIEALAAAAVAAHGAPAAADPLIAVEAAVRELDSAGVVAFAHGWQWRIRDDAAWTGGDDRVVALALSDPSASPRALEGSAARIWNAVADGPADSPDSAHIVATVAQVAGADPALIVRDVVYFLVQLRAEGLVSGRRLGADLRHR